MGVSFDVSELEFAVLPCFLHWTLQSLDIRYILGQALLDTVDLLVEVRAPLLPVFNRGGLGKKLLVAIHLAES